MSSTELTRFDGLRTALGHPMARKRLSALIGEGNVPAFATNLLVALERSERPDAIAQCSPESFVTAALACAATGLDVQSGEAALVPYGQRLTFQAMYRGIRRLVMDANPDIASIETLVVRDGDEFDVSNIDGAWKITYRPRWTGGESTHFVAIAKLKDGSIIPEVMTRKQVEELRDAYCAKGNSGPSPAWKKSFDEQGRKTVVKRLCKQFRMDSRVASILREDDGGAVLDIGEAEIVEQPKQTTQEKARSRVAKAKVVDAAPPDKTAADIARDDVETWNAERQGEFYARLDAFGLNNPDTDSDAAFLAVHAEFTGK